MHLSRHVVAAAGAVTSPTMPTAPLRILALLLLVLNYAPSIQAQSPLRAGPMLGYNTMREVAVWVQTREAADVGLRYWPVSDVRDLHYSTFAKTSEQSAYCATLIADSLAPGITYEYQVLIDDRALTTGEALRFTTPTNYAYRTEPPEFTFALGSCYYANEPAYDRPGKAYGGEYGIFQEIDSLQPDLMLWLGDNIYLRPGDFDSRSGVLHRYSHSRSIPELRGLLRSAHHYAIWDDHDYGPNDSDRSYPYKAWTREAFDLFWANPESSHEQLAGTNATGFRYHDAEFFMLDNRSKRAPNACTTCEQMPLLGDDQLDWLIDALVSSTASYKFVLIGGQVLNPARVWENYAHHHGKERRRLLERIEAEGIKNVVFLTGDRHHTELSKLARGETTLYDFTVSPLTSGATDRNKDEGNTLRVPGTFVGQRNFGTVTLSGPFNERLATLRIYDATGKLLWERVLD